MQDSIERHSRIDDGMGKPSRKQPKNEASLPQKIGGKRATEEDVASKPPEKRAKLDIFACVDGLRQQKERRQRADISVVNGYIEFFVTYINEGLASEIPDWSELCQACVSSSKGSAADSLAFILYNIGQVVAELERHNRKQMSSLAASVVEMLFKTILNQTSTSVRALGVFWSGLAPLVRIVPYNLDGVFDAEVLNTLLKKMLDSKHLNAISVSKCLNV